MGLAHQLFGMVSGGVSGNYPPQFLQVILVRQEWTKKSFHNKVYSKKLRQVNTWGKL